MEKPISCMKCKHFYTTYDPQLPRGCHKYGIKTRQMPSLVVKQQSGQDCQAFELRDIHKKKKKLDLNDDSLW